MCAITGATQDSAQKNTEMFDVKYADMLSRYVDDRGMVNYGSLKRDAVTINGVTSALSEIRKSEYNPLSEKEKTAFLINAYNFLTIKTIIDNYPIKSSFLMSVRFPKNSIRQISGIWDEIRHTVLEEMMTLNHIEHDILRVEFNEPGIHLALVCAAMGCPPLRNEPYNGARLDEQLADQTRTFAADRSKFRIDKQAGVVYLSSIFKWYGGDFIKRFDTANAFRGQNPAVRAVLNYLAPYVHPADKTFLLNGSYKISYLDYDWELNTQ